MPVAVGTGAVWLPVVPAGPAVLPDWVALPPLPPVDSGPPVVSVAPTVVLEPPPTGTTVDELP